MAEPRAIPAAWQRTLLPFPKRFSRGRAFGFALGHAVGVPETARARSAGTWWRDGRPELLQLEGVKEVNVSRAHGDLIPGSWTKNHGEKMGAAMWALRNGTIEGRDLHDASFERTWTIASGADLVIGVGVPKGKMGDRGPDVGLVWRNGAAPVVIRDPRGDVSLECTDGTRIGGNIAGRAALWRNSAASFVDLTPEGFQTARIHDAAGGLQVVGPSAPNGDRGSSACQGPR